MPVKKCTENGKNGFKWGDSGKCYTYTEGNAASKKRAKDKAIQQGRAIQVNKTLEVLESLSKTKSSEVQSLRFNKKNFNKDQAIAWARSYGFKCNDIEETDNHYDLNQFNPEGCIKSGDPTKITPGVTAYVCTVSKKKAKNSDKIEDKNTESTKTEEKSILQEKEKSIVTKEEKKQSSDQKSDQVPIFDIGYEVIYKGKKGKITNIEK